VDRIELVSIDDGEVVLFWQLPAKLAARMLRELRTDLAGLEAREFFEKWASYRRGSDPAAHSRTWRQRRGDDR